MAQGKLKKKVNFIKFLGTAGARFVMIRQERHSGGIWVSYEGTNVIIDPGPGSLVRCCQSKPKMDASVLDGIILTHKHLDHSNDMNVMIEAMTEGGYKKRGIVLCPQDALEEDPVVFKYIKNFPREFQVLTANNTYRIGDLEILSSMRHIHPVETYGLKLKLKDKTVGILTDTRYFEGLKDFYNTDILIIGVVFYDNRPNIDHMGFMDVKALLSQVKPERVILTHFGLSMLAHKPDVIAKDLSREFKAEVIAASDGMAIDLK